MFINQGDPETLRQQTLEDYKKTLVLKKSLANIRSSEGCSEAVLEEKDDPERVLMKRGAQNTTEKYFELKEMYHTLFTQVSDIKQRYKKRSCSVSMIFMPWKRLLFNIALTGITSVSMIAYFFTKPFNS